MIRVNLDSIEVRFDGYTVKTHMSRRYQEQQCGLCGHFDGEVSLENPTKREKVIFRWRTNSAWPTMRRPTTSRSSTARSWSRVTR